MGTGERVSELAVDCGESESENGHDVTGAFTNELSGDHRRRGARRKTLVVYSDDPTTDIADQFASKNVTVRYKRLRSVGPNEFLIILDEDGFQGAIGLTALREFLTAPILVPWSDEFDPSSFRDLLALLDETLFTSFDRREMLATCREFEDRAWRVGGSTLHVGFQAFSAFQAQVDVYRNLASDTDLRTHIYGRADWHPPRIRNTTFHAESTDEIGVPRLRWWRRRTTEVCAGGRGTRR